MRVKLTFSAVLVANLNDRTRNGQGGGKLKKQEKDTHSPHARWTNELYGVHNVKVTDKRKHSFCKMCKMNKIKLQKQVSNDH